LPLPAEIEPYLKQFTAGIIAAGGVTDIFAAGEALYHHQAAACDTTVAHPPPRPRPSNW
jgi:hypothetical protein